MRFVSPGKTKYKTQKSAGEALVTRNLSNCFYEKSTTSEDGNTEDDSDYHRDSCNNKEKRTCRVEASNVKQRESKSKDSCLSVSPDS